MAETRTNIPHRFVFFFFLLKLLWLVSGGKNLNENPVKYGRVVMHLCEPGREDRMQSEKRAVRKDEDQSRAPANTTALRTQFNSLLREGGIGLDKNMTLLMAHLGEWG